MQPDLLKARLNCKPYCGKARRLLQGLDEAMSLVDWTPDTALRSSEALSIVLLVVGEGAEAAGWIAAYPSRLFVSAEVYPALDFFRHLILSGVFSDL